jgi:hypothetical protein
MPQIQLTEDEYETLKRARREADERAGELQKKLDAVQTRIVGEIHDDLAAAYKAAKVCVDFMVANLHPEFIKAMPWQELETLAKFVAGVGGDGERDRERAMIWTEHVRLIKKFETERQLRGKDPEPGTFRTDKPE